MLQAQRELLWLFLIGVAFLFTLVAFVCVDPMRGVIARASLCLSVVALFAFKMTICESKAAEAHH